MKKLKLLTKIGIFLFGISLFFTSCEKDETIIIENQEHVGKSPNEVSKEKFRKTTQIDDINSFVKKYNTNNNYFARENSELTFDDFIIYTDIIYQYTLNEGNVSFSFYIEPIVEYLPTEKFNLVIEQDEQGYWISSIYQLNLNTDETVQNRFSSLEWIYSTNGISDGMAERWVGTWVETTTYHCLRTGPCANGICDKCGLCVSTSLSYEFVSIEGGESSGSGGFIYNGGGGGGGSASSSMPHMNQRNQLNELLDLQTGSQQYKWVFSSATLAQMEVLLEYLDDNRIISPIGGPHISTDAKNFTNEIIMLLRWKSSGNSERDLNALNFIVEAKKQDKIYNDIDSDFLMSVNQYMNIDISNSELHDPIIIHLLMKMALVRATQPNICDDLAEWQCDLKVFWEASKDVVHITLDVIGLVPVVGEIADLINGGLYLIEGDGVNATLSFAAAVPIAGWTATGAKYAVRIVNASQTASTIATKVKLTWKVVGSTIDFGSSSLLRKVLGITDINQQAHHLIPWAIRNHNVVQKAAKSGSAFHMNEALNGIAVASWRNQPNHHTYNNIIQNKLDAFNSLNPNANVDEAYLFVSDLINDVRNWVISNPNSHLNNLVLP